MITKNVASNGIEVSVREGERIKISTGWSIGGPDAAALREFFRLVEDDAVGRWRWPEDPNYLVYPGADGETARVVREADGVAYIWSRADAVRAASRGEVGGAVRATLAYFEHCAQSMPWRAAKYGEAWALRIPSSNVESVRDAETLWHVAVPDGSSFTSPIFGRIKVASDQIEGGRRIWPEGDA